jgi:hypothetical protein
MIKIGRKYLFFAAPLDTNLLGSLAAGVCLVANKIPASFNLYKTQNLIQFMKGPPPVVLGPTKKLSTSHKDWLLPINHKNSRIFMRWIFKE